MVNMSNTSPATQTLVETIDDIATHEPDRVWVSVPRDDKDLSKGFTDITYQQLLQGVNHAAHWLVSVFGPDTGAYERFAYEGPRDISWAVLALAAAKVSRVMLLPYPLMPPQVKQYLLKTTNSRIFLFAEVSRPSVEQVVAGSTDVTMIAVPSIESWMKSDPVTDFPFSKPWDEIKNDPWLIFHTSGTTGLPKPIVYSHVMMTSIAQSEQFPDAGEQTSMSLFKHIRVYSPLPLNHFGGMAATLASTVYLNMVLVLPPVSIPPMPAVNLEVLKHGRAAAFGGPPFMIQGLCSSPEGLQRVRGLKFVQWVGGPLDHKIGELLASHTQLAPAIGTTECGVYFTSYNSDPADWSYYSFRDYQGIEFEAVSAQHYELIIKKSATALWQQIFLLRPQLDVYRTGDIFTKHPSKPNLWAFTGRSDDMIKLSSGIAVQAAELEAIILQNPAVATALVGGAGRLRPFLMLELVEGIDVVVNDNNDNSALLQLIQKEFDTVNAQCPASAIIPPCCLLAAHKTRPFKRSGKQTVLRNETYELYEKEIEAMYAKLEAEI